MKRRIIQQPFKEEVVSREAVRGAVRKVMERKTESAIERREWKEFQDAGLLWWINRILHLFGWVIVLEVEDGTDKILDVYPARCRFRGFREENEAEGFKMLTTHLTKQIPEMVSDLDWEME